MTVLLVDAGNSRLKWATLSARERGPAHALTHGGQWSPAKLSEVLAGVPPPGRVLIGAVAGPEAEAALARACTGLWACPVDFVRAAARAAGVANGYERPEQLGVDRWLALIAAHADHAGAACIADCGTAVTVDVIDADGRHLGGMILPGVQTMSDCVLARTRVPACAPEVAVSPFGRRTAEALGAGGLNAVAGAIERSLAAAREALGLSPRLLLAGGDARNVASALCVRAELRPDLVIEGLAVLALETDS